MLIGKLIGTSIPSYIRGITIPGYLLELSSIKYTAQFKNFTTARMHWHMYGLQWHFGVIFPSQDTIWSIILFTMYYFAAINIFMEILNSIIIPSIPYRTRQARSLSRRATQFWEKTNSQQTLTYYLWQFSVLNRSINSTLTRLISRPTIIISFFLSSLVVSKITTGYIWSHIKEKPYQRNSLRKSFPQKI